MLFIKDAPTWKPKWLGIKNKIKKKKREKTCTLPSAESPIMINITISLPIHVTFKKACQKREETRANIQCDNFNFLCDNAHYISKDLQFTAYKKKWQRPLEFEFRNITLFSTAIYLKMEKYINEHQALTVWSAIFCIALMPPLTSFLSQYL